MRIILLGSGASANRSLTIPNSLLKSLPVIGLLLIVAAGYAGYSIARSSAGDMPDELVQAWATEIKTLAVKTSDLSLENERESRAYAMRLAELQARLLRMEAVGERLTQAAQLDAGEFDFDSAPAMGGPLTASPDEELGTTAFIDELDQLQIQIADRERQLFLMERLLLNRSVAEEALVTGKPVGKGYISSRYGQRADPIEGVNRFHRGVDFSAPKGTAVVATASGVVTWAGRKPDYGYMVEIRHSDGYTTRYAHNSENLVKAGDLVKKGQKIAVVGSTGRSTGSHLHFEVHQDGKSVNPMPYIQQG